MDLIVYEDSRIARLPKILQSPAVLARGAIVGTLNLVAPLRAHHHRCDGISTRHNVDFILTPRFQRANDRATKAAPQFFLPFRLHQILWCARLARKVAGDFVELGTGQGHRMSAVLADQPDFDRQVHLFDTFSSRALNKHGEQISSDPGCGYAKSFEQTKANFAEWPFVHLHKGDVRETLPKADIPQVAFLHIDLNHAPPEVFGLRFLWPRIPRGGVILLDDYAHGDMRDQYRAMNALSEELDFDILTTPTGQGIIVK